MRFAVIAAALLISAPASANPESWTFDCKFEQVFVSEISNGRHSVIKNGAPLNMTFTGFDAKGKALLVGNAGAVPVNYLVADQKLSLIQVTDTGNITITSIGMPGDGPAQPSTHSRHMWIGKSAVITHLLGFCHLRK
jgi:hypothetical protein